MRGKLLFVAGLAVGYVLGTRAGRQRYEQIKLAAKNVWESEPVQWVAGQAQDAASDMADKAVAQARKVIGQVGSSQTSARSTTTPTRKPASGRSTTTSKKPTAEPAVRGTSPMTGPISTVKPSGGTGSTGTKPAGA